MVLKIYGMISSPPVRLVLLTAEVLGCDYEFLEINLEKEEHLTPDFLKLNPQHKIPVIEHEGLILNESRAIATYLASTFNPNGSLYPPEVKKQAMIQQMLFFDIGVANKAVLDIIIPVLYGKEDSNAEGKEKKKKALIDALQFMSGFVRETGFAGRAKALSIADLCFIVTYSTVRDCKLVESMEFEELEKYFARMTSLIPNYEQANGRGSTILGEYFLKMKANSD